MAFLQIKYLDIYPAYDFYESAELPEAALTDYRYDVSKTERLWGYVYDSNKAERKIQTIVYEQYTIEDIVAKNIDYYKLEAANHVTVTTTDGDSFVAVDFDVTYEQIDGNRDSRVTIVFYKQIDILQPLSSTYAETLYTDVTNNILEFSIDKPSFALIGDIAYNAGPLEWEITATLTDELNLITVNDYYYVHFPGNVATNGNTYCQCFSKSSTEIVFTLNNYASAQTDIQLVLNQEADEITEESNVENNTVTIDIEIYTFINPIYDYIITPSEGISSEDGIEENQKLNSKKKASLRFWLTDDELYKIDHLNCAKAEDIKLTLSDTTEIVPIQVKDIYTRIEKESLLELNEFQLDLLYNNKTVNYWR